MTDPKLVLVYIAVALTLWTGSGIKRGVHRLFHPPGPEVQTSDNIPDEWRSLMPEWYRTNCRDVGWFFQKNTKPSTFMRVLCPVEPGQPPTRGLHRVDLEFVTDTLETVGHVRMRKVWKD